MSEAEGKLGSKKPCDRCRRWAGILPLELASSAYGSLGEDVVTGVALLASLFGEEVIVEAGQRA